MDVSPKFWLGITKPAQFYQVMFLSISQLMKVLIKKIIEIILIFYEKASTQGQYFILVK